MFAGPNSYSLQCMMESNDMHVNTQISLCSSFSGITTNSDFYIYRLYVTVVGSGVHACTLIQSEVKVCTAGHTEVSLPNCLSQSRKCQEVT